MMSGTEMALAWGQKEIQTKRVKMEMQTATEPSFVWYCVHARPGKEQTAERYCREVLGLETYYPRLKEMRTIRRVRRLVVRSLFPRYLFCRIQCQRNYRAVQYAPPVADLVRFGRRPAVVDPAVIAELKTWADPCVDVQALGPRFQPGEAVELNDGPLRGIQAVFLQDLADGERVAILLSTLQCQARLIVNRSELMAV
jgi:transcriptional antiterminator RfaH